MARKSLQPDARSVLRTSGNGRDCGCFATPDNRPNAPRLITLSVIICLSRRVLSLPVSRVRRSSLARSVHLYIPSLVFSPLSLSSLKPTLSPFSP
eukprot:115523-Chlamydomonas_euryale.AAC.1